MSVNTSINDSNAKVLYDLTIDNNSYDFSMSIKSAMEQAELDILSLNETIDSVKGLKPECDRLDYILAASSGALCSILDIFLVGKPGESPVGDVTDKWFADRTMDFAKLCGWNGEGEKSAIGYLERHYRIPYDQRGAGDSGAMIFELRPRNHHYKSLGHNPSLCGLFFSILDQFNETSHFVSDGVLITLEKADFDNRFELRGHNVPSKLFCAFVNWFCHCMSDVSGSSGGKGRGMGLPSPIWTWFNDVIAIKSSLDISVADFDKAINDFALRLYYEGYDSRFQAAQAIPVFINEIITRTIYSIRRLIRFFSKTVKEERSLTMMWEACEPFSNATVSRMLTVSHGAFCVIDVGDATIRSYMAGYGTFNPAEFFMRLNIIGIGRFAISLYGEGKREIAYLKAESEASFAGREKIIIEYYMEGLKILAYRYDDTMLLTFVENFQESELYVEAFNKSVKLAELRGVPPERILHNKSEIDAYFKRGV